jgi:hypothetical protein
MKAKVAIDVQTIADRLRLVHGLGLITRYHAQISAKATAKRMKLR